MTAYLRIKEFSRFNVDVVLSANTTSEPELVAPHTSIDVPGITSVAWRAYPLVDHVADKFAAIAELRGDSARPSSRYRDLVDIALIATSQQVDSSSLCVAIASEFRFRSLSIGLFAVPDAGAWRSGYNAIVAELPHFTVEYDGAVVLAARLFSVVDINGNKIWNPQTTAWE